MPRKKSQENSSNLSEPEANKSQVQETRNGKTAEGHEKAKKRGLEESNSESRKRKNQASKIPSQILKDLGYFFNEGW